MSQYLNLKLVNKTNPEMSLNLGYWSTNISRQIYSNFNEEVFPYSENAVRLDISTFKSYIKTLDEGIKEFKGYLYRAMKRKRENTDLLLKAQTEVVVKDIRNVKILSKIGERKSTNGFPYGKNLISFLK